LEVNITPKQPLQQKENFQINFNKKLLECKFFIVFSTCLGIKKEFSATNLPLYFLIIQLFSKKSLLGKMFGDILQKEKSNKFDGVPMKTDLHFGFFYFFNKKKLINSHVMLVLV
jgi:hypothetical protein